MAVDGLSITLAALPTASFASLSITAAFRAFIATVGRLAPDLCQSIQLTHLNTLNTGILSHLGPKFRDWANRQAEAGCYSWAALSSNDSKTW